MKRRTSLRAPFVVTVAASSVFGCGASVSLNPPIVQDDVVAGDAVITNDRVPSTDNPWVMETDVRRPCPATAPTANTPCTPGVDPASCQGPASTNCTVQAWRAECSAANGGRWSVAVYTCNPPPIAQCPTARPEQGSACPFGSYSPSGLRCGYDLCVGSFSTQATCSGMGATWMVQRASCNPPFVDAGIAPSDV